MELGPVSATGLVDNVIAALLFSAVGVLVLAIGFSCHALTPGNLREPVYTLRHPSEAVLLVADHAALARRGDRDSLRAFLRGASGSRHLAGVVAGHYGHEDIPALAELVHPSSARPALPGRRIPGPDGPGIQPGSGRHRHLSGLRAAQSERLKMLAVETGLFCPARVSQDGTRLTGAHDRNHLEVRDDAVDEIIETALDRGGWVAFVPDGALAERGRIALTVLPWGRWCSDRGHVVGVPHGVRGESGQVEPGEADLTRGALPAVSRCVQQ